MALLTRLQPIVTRGASPGWPRLHWAAGALSARLVPRKPKAWGRGYGVEEPHGLPLSRTWPVAPWPIGPGRVVTTYSKALPDHICASLCK